MSTFQLGNFSRYHQRLRPIEGITTFLSFISWLRSSSSTNLGGGFYLETLVRRILWECFSRWKVEALRDTTDGEWTILIRNGGWSTLLCVIKPQKLIAWIAKKPNEKSFVWSHELVLGFIMHYQSWTPCASPLVDWAGVGFLALWVVALMSR